MDIRGIGRNINSSIHEYDALKKDRENQHKAEPTKTEAGSRGDKIKISPEAKQLSIIDFAVNKIKDEIQKDASSDKIGRLKAQIKSGSYKIDAVAVADTILTGANN